MALTLGQTLGVENNTSSGAKISPACVALLCFPLLPGPMYSLTDFSVIPHEAAVERFAAVAHDAALSDFCKGIVMGMVNSVASCAELAPRRPIGQPRGSFDDEGFARLIVTQWLKKL